MESRYLKAEEKEGKDSKVRTMPKTILLVEDDDMHAELILNAFQESKSDWKIHRVISIKEATKRLKEIENKQPFVVVTDYRLPDGTGLDLAGGAKSPEELGFPLILLTGHGSEDLAVRSLKSGAMDYVAKQAEWLQKLPWTVERVHREWEAIIERKRAEAGIREKQRIIDALIQNSAVATFAIDSEHKVIYWNNACEVLTGIPAREMIGTDHHWNAFYDHKRPCVADIVIDGDFGDIHTFYEICTRSSLVPEGIRAEGWYPNLGGKKRYICFEAAPIYNTKGERIASIETLQDITERKTTEEELERLLKELEAKNAEMERFTYTVSHDLRSPLLSIQGFATVLREDLEQEERANVESDLNYIEEGAKKMELLLNDTLQLSRIGRVANPPVDVPFGEIVQEALLQITEQVKSSGVEISVADALPTVHVDRMRIAEVLVNLITNSIKYRGEQPHPKIEIGYRVDGEEAVFFVKDNGIGIDKSQHEKVFALFYKLDGSSEGTGAGLAIVKRIVEVHGGRIWIESEEGKGCTVCFTVPVCS